MSFQLGFGVYIWYRCTVPAYIASPMFTHCKYIEHEYSTVTVATEITGFIMTRCLLTVVRINHLKVQCRERINVRRSVTLICVPCNGDDAQLVLFAFALKRRLQKVRRRCDARSCHITCIHKSGMQLVLRPALRTRCTGNCDMTFSYCCSTKHINDAAAAAADTAAAAEV